METAPMANGRGAPHGRLRLGTTWVELYDGYTVSVFPGGATVDARHDDVAHLGQRAHAESLGYPDEQAMNRDHDPLHHLVALWLRLPASPILYAIAHGTPASAAWEEEAAVEALQRLCIALGIDILALAQSYSTHDP